MSWLTVYPPKKGRIGDLFFWNRSTCCTCRTAYSLNAFRGTTGAFRTVVPVVPCPLLPVLEGFVFPEPSQLSQPSHLVVAQGLQRRDSYPVNRLNRLISEARQGGSLCGKNVKNAFAGEISLRKQQSLPRHNPFLPLEFLPRETVKSLHGKIVVHQRKNDFCLRNFLHDGETPILESFTFCPQKKPPVRGLDV